ncbi:MAG: SUMF1/EgtB/PvdO family nonheme iron enzyme [Tessaracoccus sp.]|nr:SUMF1/EgtB/PvdO family nonheme iron enzyme [Tessaracoccus sp.]
MKPHFYRGGGWSNSVPSRVRAANRSRYAVSDRHSNLGFRCARVEVGP